MDQSFGGFHKWGYPNSWMVYNAGKNPSRNGLGRGVCPFMEPPYALIKDRDHHCESKYWKTTE